MSQEREVIGLTGLSNVGKGEIARILHDSYGFENVSLYSVLKSVAEEHFGVADRATLEQTYKELGEEVIANRMVLLANESGGNVVIDSIRSVRLLDIVKNSLDCNFVFVGVVAPKQERFRRMQARQRVGDPKTWDEFINLDLIQLGDISSELKGYQVRQCFSSVDTIFRNNTKSIEQLEQKVAVFIGSLKGNR